MKKIIFTLVGITFLIFSCQNELLDLQESSIQSESFSSSQQSGVVECKVKDLNRCDMPGNISNFWWPKSITGVNEWDQGLFKTGPNNQLYFTEYENGTAKITGSTILGDCYVVVDVWLEDKKDWYAFKADGGSYKNEDNDCTNVNHKILNYYVIKTEGSSITSYGDCYGEADGTVFGLEQRPDPNDSTTPHLGVLVGPGAGLFDKSDINAYGLSTWGWLTLNGERKYIFDFNFNLEECREVVCDECEGKVTDLTLQYNGAEGANIRVETKKEGENGEKVVFEGPVLPGLTFSFTGNDKKGTLGTEITIYVKNEVNTKIHTSCSEPIGPGLVSGDFEVISGSSREGGELCPVETPPGGGDDCNECEGKVNNLTLQYNGPEKANIRVETKKEGEDGSKIVFERLMVEPGDTFSFTGNDKKGTLGTEITIYVNGTVNTKIHTSCSKPIGPGLVSGDFEVISGSSREGGALCPVDTPPGGGDDCNECEGKVTRLDLVYNGDNTAQIDVVQKKDDISVFSKPVNPGETFSFSGMDDKGTLGTEIIIYVNYQEAQRIHTSCSDPIGAGAVFGDFTVLGGASREGGELCPVDVPPTNTECECKGGIVSVTFTYNGNVGDAIFTSDDDDAAFTDNGNGTVTLATSNGDKLSNPEIFVNGISVGEIHASCSDDILGLSYGGLTVVEYVDKEGNVTSVDGCSKLPPGPDCECDGGIVSVTFTNGGNVADLSSDDDDATFTDNGNGTVTLATFDGDKLSNPEIFINGNSVGEIHASCSDNILGFRYGPLTVVEYIDKEGNVTSVDGCSQLPPGDDCNECDGKVTRLDLQYNGSGRSIEIVQKKDGTEGTPLFSGPVSAGDEFTIYGQDDKGTLSTEIIITDASGTEIQRIHTSCSVDIGTGSEFGDFEVLGGSSRNGGEFCNTEGPS